MRNYPVMLEGIKVDGRWVVIYSKYDIGCAIEGHKAADCLGHDKESALQDRLGGGAVLVEAVTSMQKPARCEAWLDSPSPRAAAEGITVPSPASRSARFPYRRA